MDLFEELSALGVNIDEALNRIGGNSDLYKKLLGMFTVTMKKYYIEQDFDFSNYKETAEKAHAIKGTAGNLSIIPIYEGYSKIVNLLRSDKPEQANEVLKEILPVQNEIISCINKYI